MGYCGQSRGLSVISMLEGARVSCQSMVCCTIRIFKLQNRSPITFLKPAYLGGKSVIDHIVELMGTKRTLLDQKRVIRSAFRRVTLGYRGCPYDILIGHTVSVLGVPLNSEWADHRKQLSHRKFLIEIAGFLYHVLEDTEGVFGPFHYGGGGFEKPLDEWTETRKRWLTFLGKDGSGFDRLLATCDDEDLERFQKTQREKES